MKAEIYRVMIAGAKSGSGKTTITCGILKMLVSQGMHPVSFKCGPDYIDPMFHETVLGISSGNLDSYFMEEDVLKYLLWNHAKDITIIEGVMGFYDGIGFGCEGSSYDISRKTETPVILVLDCKGMGNSIAAMLKGFLTYKENRIRGVIFNRLPKQLYESAKQMAEAYGIKCIGYLPQNKSFELESRHLGLITANEIADLSMRIQEIAKIMKETIQIEEIIKIAAEAPEAEVNQMPALTPVSLEKKVRIAVAKDEAFCFIYPDNMELLQQLGCELVYFSPLHDIRLPEGMKGLILCGGYPELYTKQLSENVSMRKEVRDAVLRGIPTIAECGGFMYLHERLEDKDRNSYEMAGCISGACYPTNSLKRFGYVTLQAKTDNLLLNRGEKMKAHEFHYWESKHCGEDFIVKKAGRADEWGGGHGTAQLYAGFPHIHFYHNIRMAERFVEVCRNGGESNAVRTNSGTISGEN